MKLFVKILLVVFALVTNVEVVRASITFFNIQEITTSFSFQNKTPKISFKITENDLANSCKNEWDLVVYRNCAISLEVVPLKRVVEHFSQVQARKQEH